jgi:hypothetical protein
MSCDAMSHCFSGSVLRARTHAELIARDQVLAPCMTAIGFMHGLKFWEMFCAFDGGKSSERIGAITAQLERDGTRFDHRLNRHCEERQRRSNPFFLRNAMDCFASLAMTIQRDLIRLWFRQDVRRLRATSAGAWRKSARSDSTPPSIWTRRRAWRQRCESTAHGFGVVTPAVSDVGGNRARWLPPFFEAQLLVMDEACRIRTGLIWDSQSKRPEAIRF